MEQSGSLEVAGFWICFYYELLDFPVGKESVFFCMGGYNKVP